MKSTLHSSTIHARYVAVALAWIATGCGGGTIEPANDGAPRTFTGDVAGTDVRVGIVANARHARVFFCGGASSYQTMTRWLDTDVDAAGTIDLPSTPSQPWTLEGTVGSDEVTGTIAMGNAMPRPFRATAVAERTIGGLYEGTAACGRVGLILVQSTPDAIPVGQGACVGPTIFEQVNPLEPIVREPDGTIRVTVGASAEETRVKAAALPNG